MITFDKFRCRADVWGAVRRLQEKSPDILTHLHETWLKWVMGLNSVKCDSFTWVMTQMSHGIEFWCDSFKWVMTQMSHVSTERVLISVVWLTQMSHGTEFSEMWLIQMSHDSNESCINWMSLDISGLIDSNESWDWIQSEMTKTWTEFTRDLTQTLTGFSQKWLQIWIDLVRQDLETYV